MIIQCFIVIVLVILWFSLRKVTFFYTINLFSLDYLQLIITNVSFSITFFLIFIELFSDAFLSHAALSEQLL